MFSDKKTLQFRFEGQDRNHRGQVLIHRLSPDLSTKVNENHSHLKKNSVPCASAKVKYLNESALSASAKTSAKTRCLSFESQSYKCKSYSLLSGRAAPLYHSGDGLSRKIFIFFSHQRRHMSPKLIAASLRKFFTSLLFFYIIYSYKGERNAKRKNS